MNTAGRPAGGTRWTPGWTLTSPASTLFDATGVYLGMTCLPEPGGFQFDAPGLCEHWALSACRGMTHQVTPYGVRFLGEDDTQGQPVSVFKFDPATILVEGPEEYLGASLDADAEWSDTAAHIIIRQGRNDLAFLLHRGGEQSRLVITVGTGNPEGMLARARGHMSHSAHQLVDRALASGMRRGGQDRASPAPMDWVISRLRPASPVMPYPWLANDEDEPVWRMGTLFPAFLLLLEEQPAIATALLGNLLDSIDDAGKLPLAGGHASPLFAGFTETPVLVQMVMEHMRKLGRWPIGQQRLSRQLTNYMSGTSAFLTGTDHTATRETALLWKRECQAWQRYLDHTGYSSSQREASRGIQDVLPVPGPGGDPTSSLLDLLDPSLTKDRKALAAGAMDDLLAVTSGAVDTHVLELLFLTLHVAPEWETGKLDARLDKVHASLASRWREQMEAHHGAGEEGRHMDRLALASLCEWSDPSRQQDKIRQTVVLGWLHRHRRPLIGGGIVLALVVIGYLLHVQLRSSMPTTVYETRIGLARQAYETGKYDEAVEHLLDIESKGHERNPVNLYLLGKTYFRMGRFADAASVFERIITTNPDLPAAWFNLALSRFHAGQYTEAATTFAEISERFAKTRPDIAARAVKALEITETYKQ